jgi:hypothetical protein
MEAVENLLVWNTELSYWLFYIDIDIYLFTAVGFPSGGSGR